MTFSIIPSTDKPKNFDANELLPPIPKDILYVLRKLVDGRSGLILYNSGKLFERVQLAAYAQKIDLFEYEITEPEQQKLKAWFDESGNKFEYHTRRLSDIIYGDYNARNKSRLLT